MPHVLPSVPSLAALAFERQHAPSTEAEHPRAYEQFRSCLRWEFGFTCPFCLLHETQVCPLGAAGAGQFWIEHLDGQAIRPDLRNHYPNLVYTCRRCNIARRDRPRVDASGRRLLDPCVDIWVEHFTYHGDDLVATTPDGHYTADTYDVNAPPKQALRRARRDALDEALHVLATAPELLERVMARIDLLPVRDRLVRLDIAEQLHRALAAARRTVFQLSAVPSDAPDTCACHAPRVIPAALAASVIHIDLEPRRQ